VIGMCSGTAAATLGAGELNWIGLAVMLCSEVAEALRLVLTQKLLQNNNFGVRLLIMLHMYIYIYIHVCVCILINMQM